MGNLTDDMTRLCEEVGALRSARGALMRDLARGTNELAISVLAMRADFGAAHAAMAERTRKELADYVSGNRKRVARMRKTTAADLAGARRAWTGKRK